jgi:hypothetical protein
MTTIKFDNPQQELEYTKRYQKLITHDINKAFTNAGYSIVKTGNIWSVASTEFIVTKPDGTTTKVWSPPWHEYNDEDEIMFCMLHVALGLVVKEE